MSKLRNTEKGKEFAQNIEATMGNYGGSGLGSEDTESTITANENGKNIFNSAQSLLGTFEGTLRTDTGNINRLADEFEIFDEKMRKNNQGKN